MNRDRSTYLLEKLRGIRLAKYWTDIPLLAFLGCVAFFLALKAFEAEEWFKPIFRISFSFAFLGFFMLFIQDNLKCPNCGKKFNVRIGENGYFRNLFSRKCMNCGLKVNGENVGEYESDL